MWGAGNKDSTFDGLSLEEFVSVGQVNLGSKMNGLQSVVQGTWQHCLRALLKMQILGSYAKSTESEVLGVQPSNLHFHEFIGLGYTPKI